jgi:hypothetical protein
VPKPEVNLEKPTMSSLHLEHTMKTLFQRHLPLNSYQTESLACVSVAMLLAGTVQLPKIARWLHREGQQDSRIQFLRRWLDRPYLNQRLVYHPLVRQALAGHHVPEWHILLDRSTLDAPGPMS